MHLYPDLWPNNANEVIIYVRTTAEVALSLSAPGIIPQIRLCWAAHKLLPSIPLDIFFFNIIIRKYTDTLSNYIRWHKICIVSRVIQDLELPSGPWSWELRQELFTFNHAPLQVCTAQPLFQFPRSQTPQCHNSHSGVGHCHCSIATESNAESHATHCDYHHQCTMGYVEILGSKVLTLTISDINAVIKFVL